MAKYPSEVRPVLRYAAFHEGSDQAVGILESARQQDRFEPVLDQHGADILTHNVKQSPTFF